MSAIGCSEGDVSDILGRVTCRQAGWRLTGTDIASEVRLGEK